MSTTSAPSTDGAAVRAQLDHPVIDADGHWTELFPVFFDYIDEVAGAKALDVFRARYGHRFHTWYEMTPAQRRVNRLRRPSFWGLPTNTRDRAASAIPGLFYDSLDAWGIDVALVFPSVGLTIGRDVADPELSAQIFRAYNLMAKEVFAPYADRIIAVGILNLSEPTEAIEQLEEAHRLGLKALVTGGTIARPIEADAAWQPDVAKRRTYIDALGLDSPYDYDPVWAKFVELKIPLVSHSGSMGWADRSLPHNFVANHLGHFAQSHHTFARSLFLGGVTQRHPDLHVGFMEGGVGWAANLASDLVGHWEKRNKGFMDAHLKPTLLDRDEFARLYELYTADVKHYAGKIDDIVAHNLDALECDISQEELTARDRLTDEFAQVHLDSAQSITRLFSENFFFGCEADDPMTALAFDPRLGLHLKAVFGSDISHFDVIDASEVLEEAYELVEEGLLTSEDFRQFTFSNAVELYQGMNPSFFAGTVIEEATAKEPTGSAASAPAHAR